ncbi:peptidylprolyl isomerase [bacterium]|nr:peptidylprolyl isomerase [bacterium]
MVQAKEGDKVQVHYKGSLDDGSVFDSSNGGDPLEFTLGESMVIPGFEKAIVGMNVGDEKQVRVEPDDAYGQYEEDLLFDVEKSNLPPDITPEIGMVLRVSSQSGEVSNVVVQEVKDESITLDANHPLAGKPLNFDIELVAVV